MEVYQEPGPVLPSLCYGALDVVDVCYRSGHRKVHGSEFPHQALQFLQAHPTLHGRDGEKLEEFQVFRLWEGNCAHFCVNQPPQNFFLAGPVAIAYHQLLDADGILGFTRKGRKNPF